MWQLSPTPQLPKKHHDIVNKSRSIKNKKYLDMEKNQTCNHDHHSIIPILVILFAISFLLQYQGLLAKDAVNIIWPILVGLAGMIMIVEDKCRCC